MSNLVPVPYDTRYKATPDTVALLLRACAIAGHNIPLTDGWRSYNDQLYYRKLYLSDPSKYPFAADPNTGQRNHMRGAAFDIANKADRQAMLSAGFTPDGSEWWHFNNPNWANMPIIPDDTGSAALSATHIPLPGDEDDNMKFWSITPSGTIMYGSYPIPSMDRYYILVRYHNSTIEKRDTFNNVEAGWINEALAANGMHK